MNPSLELRAALDAAAQASNIALSLYQRNLEVGIKEDKSPVTEADVRCEVAIREILESRFPSYGFYGEETGARRISGWSIRSTAPRLSSANIPFSRPRLR
jgi:fructose-1,6-bisphosphatase/inositol monophosphatase family enzyme